MTHQKWSGPGGISMSLHQHAAHDIPAETSAVARAACPKGTRAMRLRDLLGPVFSDADFAGWFAADGRSATSPALLSMVCVLQSMEDLTDRDAANAVRTRLDWKYALGVELTYTGFDFSVLSEFRDRLAVDERCGLLLTAILRAASEAGLLRSGGRARTDSTHVLANLRKINRLEIIGETVRAALEQLAEHAPGWLAPRIQPGWEPRYARRIESARLPTGESARAAWAAQVAHDGGFLLDQIDAAPEDAWINRFSQVTALREIWEQQCARDGSGTWHYRKESVQPGARFISSPHDTEARWSAKRSTEWIGYKVHLTETCDPDGPHLITQVETTTATLTDIDALPLVQAGLETAGHQPQEHYLDAGYATAEVIARAAEAGTEIIAPVLLDSSWQAKAAEGYDRAGFHIDWDQRHALCPGGKTSASWHDVKHPYGTGVRIGFSQDDCGPCPARALCTRSASTGRQILLPPRVLHEIQQRNRAEQNDPAWRRRYNTRAGIEGTISDGVRGYGLRRCRYTGLDKTRVQHILAACGMNAARIADWDERDGHPTAPRRGSRLKALCKETNTEC